MSMCLYGTVNTSFAVKIYKIMNCVVVGVSRLATFIILLADKIIT